MCICGLFPGRSSLDICSPQEQHWKVVWSSFLWAVWIPWDVSVLEHHLLAPRIPASWHAACALVVSTVVPIIVAVTALGFGLRCEFLYLVAEVGFVSIISWLLGVEYLSRVAVRAYEEASGTPRNPLSVPTARLRLLYGVEIRHSLERLGLPASGVLLARRIIHFGSAMTAAAAIALGLLV